MDCTQDRAQLDAIAQFLEAARTDSHLTEAETQHLIPGINVVLKALLQRDDGLSRSAAQTKASLNRVLTVLSDLSNRPNSEIDSAVMTDQSGGIAAGRIQTLNETNISPYLEQQSKFSVKLQAFVSDGENIREALLPSDITNSQIDVLAERGNAWGNEVAGWLDANMGPAARSRLLNMKSAAIDSNCPDPTIKKSKVFTTPCVSRFLPSLITSMALFRQLHTTEAQLARTARNEPNSVALISYRGASIPGFRLSLSKS